MQVNHMEGTDHLLLAPGGGEMDAGDARLRGEVAMVRTYEDGRLRMAVLKGEHALAATRDWSIESSGPAAVEIRGKETLGESSGRKHLIEVKLPPHYGPAHVSIDGDAVESERKANALTIPLPAGQHRFRISPAE
jgi:hypothetical protein